MACSLRIEFPGAVYHVTSRGDRREPIFEDAIDRLALLDVRVDPLPRATLFDLGGLQEGLEQWMGPRVDVLTPRDLPAKCRDRVVVAPHPL